MTQESKASPEDDTTGGGQQALVIGAGGGIGSALLRSWAQDDRFDRVWALSRDPALIESDAPQIRTLAAEPSQAGIRAALETVRKSSPRLTRVAITIGTLHGTLNGASYGPEKSLGALREDTLAEVFRVNCSLPLLWVAALGQSLRREPDCRIAVLSARIGSIGDNELGGWYAYRCAKAALNMGLKSAAVELQRRARGLKLLAYHPGTVDTDLSRPFQKNVPQDRLFTPEYTARCLSAILDRHPPDGELSYVDYDDRPIPW